jgi:hypothetical protein
MMRGDASSLSRNHAGVRIQKLLQQINILVVDVFDIILSEIAFFSIHKFSSIKTECLLG